MGEEPTNPLKDRVSQPFLACKKERNIFLLILLGGFIHGLIYIFLVNPWGHYDEPGHFEYAWLAANRVEWPKIGDYDLTMRKQVLESMKEAGFYRAPLKAPKQKDLSKPLAIGYSQVGDPPLYYLLTSLPLHLLHNQPVELQLYVGRFLSLFFLLMTISAGYGLVMELSPEGSHLRWMVPSFLAMLPGFVEFMTSFSNHPMAIGLMSVWIWLSVRLIRRGAGTWELLSLVSISFLSMFTQKTSWIVIILLPFVLVLTFLRKKRWVLWPSSLVFLFAIALLTVNYTDAAFWIRRNTQEIPTRSAVVSPQGFKHAALLEVNPESTWQGELPVSEVGLYQIIPPEVSTLLKGRPATIGAWVWSDRPIKVYGPGLNALCGYFDRFQGFPIVEVGNQPVFIAANITIPADNCRLQFWLRGTSPGDEKARVFFTGMVLTEGQLPLDSIPAFTNSSGKTGIWQEKAFVNLVRNPVLTDKWPSLKPWFYKFIKPIYELNPSSFQSALTLVWDFTGSSWYTQTTTRAIFDTFWAKFGWGNVPLLMIPGILSHPYRILAIVTFIGMFGFVVWLIRRRRKIYWAEVGFLLLVIIIVIISTYIYGTITMGGALRYRAYYPMARYLYPAIIAISFFLNAGWKEIYTWPGKWIQIPRKVGVILYLTFFTLLDFYAIASVYSYYHFL